MPDFYFDMLCDRHFGQYQTALGAGSEHASAICGAVLNQKRERRIRLQTAVFIFRYKHTYLNRGVGAKHRLGGMHGVFPRASFLKGT